MKGHIDLRAFVVLLVGAATFAVACGKETKQEGTSSTSETAKREEAKPTATAGTGKIILVEAYSDANGNYFKPNKIEAHKGDVVRFVLKSGVHNVHFLADSNPGKTGLPPASDMLQLPDQAYDVNVTFAEGHYYFQCDPHALLGMIGHLEVED
ncbi:MAG: plastocyanin/azurin family copper-binding protein [bacterium]